MVALFYGIPHKAGQNWVRLSEREKDGSTSPTRHFQWKSRWNSSGSTIMSVFATHGIGPRSLSRGMMNVR